MSFEVVLNENGQILTQYKGIDPSYWPEPGASATIGLENETGTTAFQYSYNESVLTDQLAIRYKLPPMEFVQGYVKDQNDGVPIAGATVRFLHDGAEPRQVLTNDQGFYRTMLKLGSYTIEASASKYSTETASVTLDTDGGTLTQTFALRTPRAPR